MGFTKDTRSTGSLLMQSSFTKPDARKIVKQYETSVSNHYILQILSPFKISGEHGPSFISLASSNGENGSFLDEI
jgi:hypothetical protein